MRNALRMLVASLALMVLLTSSPAAQAVSNLDVQAREQADGTAGLLVRMPPEYRLSVDGALEVEVTVGDRRVESEVLGVRGTTNEDRVLLLVDTSGSMQGARLRQVRQAVDELADSLDPGVLLGLATFADGFRVLVAPTTDRQEVKQALADIRGDGDTALFSALLTVIEDDGAERIIVLTDGQDTASSVGAGDVVGALSANPIPIDVISLDVLGNPTDSLTRVIDASGGSAILIPEDVAASLRRSAAGLPALLWIGTDTAWTEVLNGQTIEVSVTDPAGRTFVGATSVTASPSVTQSDQQAIVGPTEQWRPYLLALLAFVAVVIGTATAFGLIRRRRSRTGVKRVLSHYATPGVRTPPGASHVGDQAPEPRPAPLALMPRAWAVTIRRQVENADLPFTPVGWVFIQATLMIAVFGLLVLIGLPAIVALLGLLLSAVLMQAVVRARIESSRRRFDSELADFFTLLASGLRSGLSLAQAVSGAAHSGSDVMARQMRRVNTEVALGMDLADALDGVASRMKSQDLALAVQAVRIQREAGGSLSNILDIAASSVRQRSQLQREVRALSAEGRISAIILMVLPLAVFAFFFVTRRDYVEIFWTEPAGWVMLSGLVLILGIGAIWMQRMTKIDI